jgi:hypothetical protein
LVGVRRLPGGDLAANSCLVMSMIRPCSTTPVADVTVGGDTAIRL